MSIDWVILAGYTALFAAIIGAVVSLIGQRINRSNAKLAAQISRQNAILAARLEAAKALAQSRQNWIDELRKEMARFTVMAAQNEELWNKDKVLSSAAMIQLRLNPADEHYSALDVAMTHIVRNESTEKQTQAVKNFLTISQRILKKEWQVLKSELASISQIEGETN